MNNASTILKLLLAAGHITQKQIDQAASIASQFQELEGAPLGRKPIFIPIDSSEMPEKDRDFMRAVFSNNKDGRLKEEIFTTYRDGVPIETWSQFFEQPPRKKRNPKKKPIK